MNATFRRRPRTDVWFCDLDDPQQRYSKRYQLNATTGTLTLQQTNGPEQHLHRAFARQHGIVLPPHPADVVATTPVAFAQAYDRFVQAAGRQPGANPELVQQMLRAMSLPATGLEFLLLLPEPTDPLQRLAPAAELAEQIRTSPPELPGLPEQLNECSSDAQRRQFCQAALRALDDKLYDWVHEHGGRGKGPQVAILDRSTHDTLQVSFARYLNYNTAQPTGRVTRYTSQFGSVELLVDHNATGRRMDIYG